jgi:thioredoxin reductase (NADPH)
VEEASYLTKFASKVYMIVRRDVLRASKIMQERAFSNPKIEILWKKRIRDIHGEEQITGVTLFHSDTKEEEHLELSGLFMALGHTPITAFLDGQLELDEAGYIKLADPGGSRTSVEGVFAGGDVADHVYRQAITAAGMGCRAAIDAERWLAAQGIE